MKENLPPQLRETTMRFVIFILWMADGYLFQLGLER
jgi:hypothetical protein